MKSSSFLAAASLSFFVFSSVVVLSQDQVETPKGLADKFSYIINRPEVCEAYPYLSADGLRLYFTTNREGGHGRLYFCSRTSKSGDFSAPRPLSQNFPDGYYAATLTADELTIYASYEGEIYSSVRGSMNDQFVKPTVIDGLAEGRKFAPSISQDGNELIVFFDGKWNGKDIAIHYRKNLKGEFKEVNRLKAPADVDFDPGQFSKDGLSFYASYQLKNEVKEPDGEKTLAKPSFIQKIVRFTRESLQDNFTTSEEVPELNSSMQNHQPTMNDDETIFIVANATADSWSKNELRLVDVKKDHFAKEPKTFISPDPLTCYFVTKSTYLPAEKLKLNEPDLNNYLRLHLIDSLIPGCSLPFKEFDATFILTSVLLDSLNIEYDDVCDFSTGTKESIIEALPENDVQIKVYPNPFVSDVIIILGKIDLNPTFDMYDISGRKILSTKLNNVLSRVRLNKPGSGIYIYKITDKTGKLISSGKLVKK